MKISVILPALNESEHIKRAVLSVMKAGADEVIVVDGGSEDETCSIAASTGCEVLHSQKGRGFQLNHGAMHATGDVFLFMHADCFVSPTAINQMRSAMRSSRCQFGAFHQRIMQWGCLFRLLEIGNLARIRLFRLPYGDQGIFIRREFYFEVGGFPQRRIMEDVELSRNAGNKIRPMVLKGPIFVSGRGWRHGVIRQTLFNWSLLFAHFLGKPNEVLADQYEKKR